MGRGPNNTWQKLFWTGPVQKSKVQTRYRALSLSAMASAVMKKTLTSIKNPLILRGLSSQTLRFSAVATASNPESEGASSSFTFNEKNSDKDDSIHVKGPSSNPRRETTSVTMPMSFMTGSIVGKRFYKQASTREADDGNGWTVMLDYRTLKTPSKRPLKLPTLSLAKAIAAEWEYQVLILSHQPKLDFCWPLNLLGFIKNCSVSLI